MAFILHNSINYDIAYNSGLAFFSLKISTVKPKMCGNAWEVNCHPTG